MASQVSSLVKYFGIKWHDIYNLLSKDINRNNVQTKKSRYGKILIIDEPRKKIYECSLNSSFNFSEYLKMSII